jgi:EAL domain-containing protein (putative c-di-GMP-specific phosphodiesterase class I)/GGDEF domain-containing protein
MKFLLLPLAMRGNANVAALMLVELKYTNNEFNPEQQRDCFQSFVNYAMTMVREGDNIAQIRPNVIAIVLYDINKFVDANTVAARILMITDHFVDTDKKASNVELKIGVVCYPLDGSSPDQLLKNAESALEIAKTKEGNFVQSSPLIGEYKQLPTMTVVDNLTAALERNEFYLRYQPIFDLQQREIIGVEALLRWDHPLLGTITPNDFLLLAEKSGLIVPIGKWVLTNACEQYQKWKRQNIKLERIYINISSLQLKEQDYVTQVTEILKASGIRPIELTLEITDIALLNNLGVARDQLLYLQALGVQIAIDDFGGGFSSLSYFEALPANAIKIDRTFINGVPNNLRDAAVVNSVITLSRNFAVTVIAEGIETQEQLNFLTESHCNLGQGFLLCRPLLPEDFADFYNQQHQLSN